MKNLRCGTTLLYALHSIFPSFCVLRSSRSAFCVLRSAFRDGPQDAQERSRRIVGADKRVRATLQRRLLGFHTAAEDDNPRAAVKLSERPKQIGGRFAPERPVDQDD